MTAATKTLQEAVIRHMRGLLSEWEKWLQAQSVEPRLKT
jgi:hypothetical protein